MEAIPKFSSIIFESFGSFEVFFMHWLIVGPLDPILKRCYKGMIMHTFLLQDRSRFLALTCFQKQLLNIQCDTASLF